LTNKQILIKSIRLSIILTIVNVVFSIVLSKVFSGSFEMGQITGYLGNVTLLEVMLLLLYGSAIDFTSTTKWSSAMKLLRITTKRNEDEEMSVTRVGKQMKLTKNRMRELEGDKTRSAERRALLYVLCGAILLAEIVALALLSS
jgi:hypothetical protein